MKNVANGLGVLVLLMSSWLAGASAQAEPVIIGDAAAPLAGMGGFAGVGGGVAPFNDLRVVNAGAGIPVGGGLLIYNLGSGVAPTVEVSDVETPTTTLGGTLTMVPGGQYWVWVPTLPFTVGNTYQVRLSSIDFGISNLTDTFEVIPAITIARPEITMEPSASWFAETSNTACCRSLFSGFLQDSSCFPSEQRASIMVDPGFTTMAPAALLNQFLFRAGTSLQPASTAFPSLWPNITLGYFSVQAEEYCIELEAIDIVSNMVFTYDDEPHCAPHGDLDDLGTLVIEPGAAELDHLVCHAPPAQFEEEWCELNEEPCAEDALATACGLYGHVCRDEPLPPDPFQAGFGGMVTAGMGGFGAIGGAGAGAGGSAGAGAMSGSSGDGSGGSEGGASGMSDDGEGGSDGGGCSVAGASSTQGSSLAWCLGAAAIVLASRRRRS